MDSAVERHSLAEGRPSDGADARAITAFLAIGRRRPVASGSMGAKLPSRRYEELCLTLELSHLQRRCLASSLSAGSEFRPLVGGIDKELVRQEIAVRRMRKWLSPRARRQAEARAKRRREAIAADVKVERLSPMVSTQPSPEASRAPAPRPVRAPAIKVTAYAGRPKADVRPSPNEASRPLPSRPRPLDRRPAPSRSVEVAARERRHLIRWEQVKSLRGVNASTMRAVGAAVALAALLAWTGLPFSSENAPSSGAGTIAPEVTPAVEPVAGAVTDRAGQGGSSARGRGDSAGDQVAGADRGSDAPGTPVPFAGLGLVPQSSSGSGETPSAAGPGSGSPGSAFGDVDNASNDRGGSTDISGAAGAATEPIDDQLDAIPGRP